MAITTLPIALHTSPSPANSPTSDTDKNSSSSKNNTNNTANVSINNPPRTPVSPTMPSQPQPPSNGNASQSSPQIQAKRKPSRRANTAERRATHNAVERQRRETLNGRFLDLAALLPNLSQIRRPSKSSIVNSSIAHIHASRRHRMLASRELRLLKLEADALRRELNEWRERSGIQRIEEPVRGEGFGMVIGGELEVIVGVNGADDDEDDDGMDGASGNYGGYVGGDGVIGEDEYGMDVLDTSAPTSSPVVQTPGAGSLDDPRMLAMLKSQQSPFAHGVPTGASNGGPAGLPHILPRPGSMGGGPTNVPAFDALYEHYPPQGLPHHGHPAAAHHPHHPHQQLLQQHAYLQQQREKELRENQRERDMQIIRDRAIMQQHQQHQQQHHHHHSQHQQQEQEKMWGLYGGGPPSSRAGPGGFNPSVAAAPPHSQYFPGQPSSHQNRDQHMMMMQAQRSLFTPPATSHGLPTPSPTTTHASSSVTGPNNAANNNGAVVPLQAGSPSSSTGGDDVPQQHQTERSLSVHSRSSRGSNSPSYELGVGVGMGGPVGEYMSVGGGPGASGTGGNIPDYNGVGIPRMSGGMMGMEMLGVGVEMN